jgi:hypothetical protein
LLVVVSGRDNAPPTIRLSLVARGIPIVAFLVVLIANLEFGWRFV